MNLIAVTPEFWRAIGLSPMEIALTLGLIAVFGWAKIAIEANKLVRESWHAETRKEVDEAKAMITAQDREIAEMRKHIEICEKDRVKLSIEQVSMARELDTMKLLIASYRACSVVECPMKRHGH